MTPPLCILKKTDDPPYHIKNLVMTPPPLNVPGPQLIVNYRSLKTLAITYLTC